jgi:hypothetical protein
MEYLREMLPEYNTNTSDHLRGLERTVTAGADERLVGCRIHVVRELTIFRSAISQPPILEIPDLKGQLDADSAPGTDFQGLLANVELRAEPVRARPH